MKSKSNALYAGVLAGIIALPVTAIAAGETTNFGTTANPINTATNQGVGTVQQSMSGANMGEATGVVSGGGLTNDGLIVEGADIQNAINNCSIPEAQAMGKQRAMEMAGFGIDVDKIFNPAAEKAKGCLAATQEIINLAVEIPNISSIFDAGAALLQKKVNEVIQNKLMEIVDKGCEIADQAVRDTIEPLADFIDKYESTMDEAYSVFGEYESQARKDGKILSTSDYLRQMDLGFGSPDKGSQSGGTAKPASPSPASRSAAFSNIYGSAPSQQSTGSQPAEKSSAPTSSLGANPY